MVTAFTHTLGALSIGNSTLGVATSGGIGGFSTGAGLAFTGLTTLTGNAGFNVGSGGYLQLVAVTDGGASYGFTKSGDGILNITGSSNTSGAITGDGGVLRASNILAFGTGARDGQLRRHD